MKRLLRCKRTFIYLPDIYWASALCQAYVVPPLGTYLSMKTHTSCPNGSLQSVWRKMNKIVTHIIANAVAVIKAVKERFKVLWDHLLELGLGQWSLRKWHWTWHLKHGFVNKYYVQLCWSHFYFSYKTGSRERLECRVCVGEGHETRLERWAGTRSWKALHTILGNFVLSWGWWILWTTEGLEARLRETSSNLYFRRVSLRKLTVEDWLEKARLH